MPRKKRGGRPENNKPSFRFEWVSWTPSQLTELSAFAQDPERTVFEALQTLADNGWKVSVSENQQTGRYLFSLTDKWGRQGLAGVSFGIEHSQVDAGLYGALYFATEIIGEGSDGAYTKTVDDLW